MPLFGPPNVQKMTQKKDISGLIKALNYQKSVDVRVDAARSLHELMSPEAVEPLIEAMHDENARVRAAAASSIFQCWQAEDDRPLQPLIDLLQDEDWKVRIAAVKGLSCFKNGDVIPPIMAMIAALDSSIYEFELKQISSMLVKVGRSAIEPLKQALLQDNQKARTCAAMALEKLKWTPGEDVFGAAYHVQQKSYYMLKDYGAIAIEPLSLELVSSDVHRREEAAKYLGNIKDERIIPLLSPLLDDPAQNVRAAAVQALEGNSDADLQIKVNAAREELHNYYADKEDKAIKERAQKRKAAYIKRKELIQKSICKIRFRNERAYLDPGDGKLTLAKLFQQDEPAVVYELDEIQKKLDDFPWDDYPVAVNFGVNKKPDSNIFNFFRCTGTFWYDGVIIRDDRPRIYRVYGGKTLGLFGDIEYEDNPYRSRSEGAQQIKKRRESVYDLSNYGFPEGKFEEVMKDSLYAMRLMDVDIDEVLKSFKQSGTKFRSRFTEHIIRDDNDDIQFRIKAAEPKLERRKKLEAEFKH